MRLEAPRFENIFYRFAQLNFLIAALNNFLTVRFKPFHDILKKTVFVSSDEFSKVSWVGRIGINDRAYLMRDGVSYADIKSRLDKNGNVDFKILADEILQIIMGYKNQHPKETSLDRLEANLIVDDSMTRYQTMRTIVRTLQLDALHEEKNPTKTDLAKDLFFQAVYNLGMLYLYYHIIKSNLGDISHIPADLVANKPLDAIIQLSKEILVFLGVGSMLSKTSDICAYQAVTTIASAENHVSRAAKSRRGTATHNLP